MTSERDAELVYDAWTSLSYKRILGARKTPGTAWLAPTWVGEDHTRRLMAYKMLAAYLDNASRFFRNLTENGLRDEEGDLREYGDAALLRNQALSAMLGEEPVISVIGASSIDPEDDSLSADDKAVLEQQDWIDEWAERERFRLKLFETERNSIGLGDGLYTLGYNPRRKRIRLRTFDPGFYFPVLDDNDDDEYPDRVHVAWEIDDPTRPNETVIRRITWEMRELPDGETRNYPWNDEPSNVTCYMTDATWVLDNTASRGVDDFTQGRATYATYTDSNGEVQEWKDVDLQLDFVPVIHIPNTVALAEHYGRALISAVLQILDDLMNADTDLNAASATTGKPPIALSGVRMANPPVYKAGAVWTLGENGTLTTVDTSAALAALQQYVLFLLRRLSVNVRIPEEILGRLAEGGDAQLSGISRRLKYGPLESMVREMHMVRDEKYQLLFKMVWRMSLAYDIDKTPQSWTTTILEYGTYLPSDEAAAVDLVNKLLVAKAISVETGIKILIAAGLPIEDVNEEVLLIQYRDFDGANKLLDATGDEKAVFDYLGMEPPPTPPAPVAPTPGAPPVNPAGTNTPIPPGGQGTPPPGGAGANGNQPVPGERGAVPG